MGERLGSTWIGSWLLALTVLLVACGPSGGSAPAAGSAPGAAGARPSAPTSAPAAAQPAAQAPTRAPERMKVAYVALSGGYLPLWVAQDAGLFRDNGLDVEFVFSTGPQAAQALLAREVEVSVTDGGALVRAGLASGEVVLIGATTSTFAFKLIGQPSIRRVEDLRGKNLGITRAGATTDTAARYMLRRYGLQPDADVPLIQTGGNPEMLQAYVAGAIQAGIMSDPTSFFALREGGVEILDLSSMGVDYPVYGVGTLRSTVRERPEALRAFMKAYVEAIAWLNKNRAETMEILAKYSRRDDPEILAATYDLYQSKYIERVPNPTLAGIQTILDVAKETEPRAHDAKPTDFVDDRFVRELDDSGYIRRLYE